MAKDDNTEELVLHDGAVSLTDALGFRYAAKTPAGAALVVSTVRATRKVTETEALLNNLGGEVHLQMAAISDTIIVAGSTRGTLALHQVIASIASSAATQQQVASGAKLPLAYRGCIACGKLAALEDDLFVGQAIDEAATWYEKGLAAVVWLTPAAAAEVAPHREEYGPLFFDAELPIRDVGLVSLTAVNPFYPLAARNLIRGPGAVPAPSELQSLYARLMAPFDTSQSLDVALKRQQTYKFLGNARADLSATYTVWAQRRHNALAQLGPEHRRGRQ